MQSTCGSIGIQPTSISMAMKHANGIQPPSEIEDPSTEYQSFLPSARNGFAPQIMRIPSERINGIQSPAANDDPTEGSSVLPPNGQKGKCDSAIKIILSAIQFNVKVKCKFFFEVLEPSATVFRGKTLIYGLPKADNSRCYVSSRVVSRMRFICFCCCLSSCCFALLHLAVGSSCSIGLLIYQSVSFSSISYVVPY